MHPILDQHSVIAWDMDNTLIDGPNSEFFLEYIAAHPEKRHHVITFRNRWEANDVWGQLRGAGLDTNLIRSVESCPEPIHDCYMIRRRADNRETRARYLEMDDLTRDQFNAYADAFVFWKGERAAVLKCTILVDDMPAWVLPGCYEHGVAFHHAFDPIQALRVS
jgi:hypothetical protein